MARIDPDLFGRLKNKLNVGDVALYRKIQKAGPTHGGALRKALATTLPRVPRKVTIDGQYCRSGSGSEYPIKRCYTPPTPILCQTD